MTARGVFGYGVAAHAAHQRPHLPHRGAHPPRQGDGGHPRRPQGRAGRPQRLGQDHAAAPDRRRARPRRRRHQHSPLDPHRLGGAGSAGRAGQPDRVRARRRQGARAAAGRGGNGARSRPHRRHPRAARRHRRACGPGPGRAHPRGPRLRRGGAAAPLRGVLRRLAHARGAGGHAVRRARPAAARRAHQLPRPRGHDVARGLPRRLSAHRADRQPRSRSAQPLGRRDPAPGPGQAHALHRRLRRLRGGAAREAAPRPQAQEEAGRRAPPHRGVHHPLQGQGLEGRPGAEPHQGAGAHAADRRADRGAGGPLPARRSGQGASPAR